MTAKTTTTVLSVNPERANLTAPGNKRDIAKLEAMDAATAARVTEVANELYDGTRTVAKAWTEAFARVAAEQAEPVAPKRTRKAKAAAEPKAPARAANRPVTDADPIPATATAHRAKAPLEFAGQPVEGYLVRWEFPAVDFLKGTADRTEGTPAWMVRCNLHGETAPAVNVEDAKKVGTKAARETWCKGCKKTAAAKARLAK